MDIRHSGNIQQNSFYIIILAITLGTVTLTRLLGGIYIGLKMRNRRAGGRLQMELGRVETVATGVKEESSRNPGTHSQMEVGPHEIIMAGSM